MPDQASAWIRTEPTGYRFVAPPESAEHLRFGALRAAAAQARARDDPLVAHELLEEALALWRGPPFVELEELEWARAEIQRLTQERDGIAAQLSRANAAIENRMMRDRMETT